MTVVKEYFEKECQKALQEAPNFWRVRQLVSDFPQHQELFLARYREILSKIDSLDELLRESYYLFSDAKAVSFGEDCGALVVEVLERFVVVSDSCDDAGLAKVGHRIEEECTSFHSLVSWLPERFVEPMKQFQLRLYRFWLFEPNDMDTVIGVWNLIESSGLQTKLVDTFVSSCERFIADDWNLAYLLPLYKSAYTKLHAFALRAYSQRLSRFDQALSLAELKKCWRAGSKDLRSLILGYFEGILSSKQSPYKLAELIIFFATDWSFFSSFRRAVWNLARHTVNCWQSLESFNVLMKAYLLEDFPYVSDRLFFYKHLTFSFFVKSRVERLIEEEQDYSVLVTFLEKFSQLPDFLGFSTTLFSGPSALSQKAFSTAFSLTDSFDSLSVLLHSTLSCDSSFVGTCFSVETQRLEELALPLVFESNSLEACENILSKCFECQCSDDFLAVAREHHLMLLDKAGDYILALQRYKKEYEQNNPQFTGLSRWTYGPYGFGGWTFCEWYEMYLSQMMIDDFEAINDDSLISMLFERFENTERVDCLLLENRDSADSFFGRLEAYLLQRLDRDPVSFISSFPRSFYTKKLLSAFLEHSSVDKEVLKTAYDLGFSGLTERFVELLVKEVHSCDEVTCVAGFIEQQPGWVQSSLRLALQQSTVA